MSFRRTFRTCWLWGAGAVAFAGLASAAEPIDFNRDIRPILSNKCATCHGPDEAERKADLRLDTESGAKADLGGYAAIVAGDPAKSELIHRVTTTEEDDLMPPKSKGGRLSPREVELLTRWIQEGGTYAKHWSYVKPVRPALPKIANTAWPKNSIDHFILAHLEKEKLSPSPEADRRTLIRRVATDLTGLPPTPQEVSEFMADQSPTAYEAMVDRYLARETFGEHWARHWLDLARYADSAGYPSDPGRTIWAYRDWVIQSFNKDLPFDQFTIHQMAGDLLPNPTGDQLIATAFHRNTMTQNEGGTSDEEFRTAAVVDRVNTTFSVWMGTSMACAQCHTHKFDPISQHEYFGIYAILNNTADADKKDESPLFEIHSAEQLAKKEAWLKEQAALRKTLATATPALAKEQAAWEKTITAESTWTVAKPLSAKAAKDELAIAEDGTVKRTTALPAQDVYTVELPLTGGEKLTALRLETAPQGGNFVITQIAARIVPKGDTTVKARFVRLELPGENRMIHVAEVQAFSSGANVAPKGKASQSSDYPDAPAKLAIDNNTDGRFQQKSVSHTAESKDPWWEVDLGSAQPLDRVVIWNRTDGGASIQDRLKGYKVVLLDEKRQPVWQKTGPAVPAPSVELSPSGVQNVEFAAAFADYVQKEFSPEQVFQKEAKDDKGWAVGGAMGQPHHLTLLPKTPIAAEGKLVVTVRQDSKFPKLVLNEFRFATTTSPNAAELARIPPKTGEGLRVEPAKRTPAQAEAVAAYYRTIAPSLKKERDRLAQVEKDLAAYKAFTSVPVMKEMEGDKRRKTFLQIRGSWNITGDEVFEGTPAVFNPLPEGPRNRLALAKWLVSPDNPLTARVLVNRFWEQIFGAGLVRTSEEFGSQGELPSNPELLDWLAVEIQETGWSLKNLVRLYVTSAAYRQSSKVTPEMAERDPENRLLARGPRFRPSGEMLRDQALFVSGLLSENRYGPPVRPLRPSLGLTTAFGGTNDWVTSEGEARHRRSVYTEVRRNSPYPSFATFDAPNREVCTIRRDRTNTPLQAFVTLNDPVFVEAAQGLARRLMKEGGADTASRLKYAYELCLSRPITDTELSKLTALYDDALAGFQADAAAANSIATDPLGPLPDGADTVTAAAWTTVSNVILNLDEFLMRR